MGSELVERFAAVRQAMDTCRSHAGQAVLSTFIREGHFTRHIRRMRKIYEERRRILVEEIEQQFGSLCRITGAAAGMHLTVLFDDQLHDARSRRKHSGTSYYSPPCPFLILDALPVRVSF